LLNTSLTLSGLQGVCLMGCLLHLLCESAGIIKNNSRPHFNPYGKNRVKHLMMIGSPTLMNLTSS